MKSHPDSPQPADKEPRAPQKHSHGRLFRWKIVPFGGSPKFGEWLATEAEVRVSLKRVTRSVGERCYCETKAITCPECDMDEAAKVICSL